LVKFIGRGVGEYDQDNDGRLAPAPRAEVVPDGFAYGPPEEPRKDGIFGEMRAFAQQMVNEMDVRPGHARKQPVEKRLNEERGMFVRVRVGGAGKNQTHPAEWQQPVPDERDSFRHRDRK